MVGYNRLIELKSLPHFQVKPNDEINKALFMCFGSLVESGDIDENHTTLLGIYMRKNNDKYSSGSELHIAGWGSKGDLHGEHQYSFGDDDFYGIDASLEYLLGVLGRRVSVGVKEVYWFCQQNITVVYVYKHNDGEESLVFM